MFRTHAITKLLREFKPFVSIYGAYCSADWKNSFRNVHSEARSNTRRQFQPAGRETKVISRSAGKDNVAANVYMRDIILRISNILRFSSWDSAKEQLEDLSIKWDSFTVNQVLKTHPPMEKAWLFFNWASKLKGFKHDRFTYTTMLDIFGEANRISSMKYVYQQMQEKGIDVDVVTCTSLIQWLSKAGDIDGAMKIWWEMKANGCYPTVVSYTAYMKILFDHKKVKEATDVYKEMLESGLPPNCYTYTVLMEHLIDSGKFRAAMEIFYKMQEAGVLPDKAMCNIMVEKCSKAGEMKIVAQILHYMKDNRLVLRYPVYLLAHECFKMAGEDGHVLRQANPHIHIEDKDHAHEQSEEAAHNDQYGIDRGLMLILLRRKSFIAVDRLFSEMANENIRLDAEIVSSIIRTNCDHGRSDHASLVFDYSNRMGIQIEEIAYLSLLGISIRANEFSKVLDIIDKMKEAGFFIQPDFASLLIHRLGCSKQLSYAERIFELLPEQSKCTTTYTALIAACFLSGNTNKGVETYKIMRREGIPASSGTYCVIIHSLEKVGRVDEARLFRDRRNSLQADGYYFDATSMEEKLCNKLFSSYMAY